MYLFEPEYQPTTATLTGGSLVEFDVPDTTSQDTAPTDPVRAWLEVCPTATETDPD